MFFGGVHTVMELAGIISGAGDDRRNGVIATTDNSYQLLIDN